jgi:hypothetical protein
MLIQPRIGAEIKDIFCHIGNQAGRLRPSKGCGDLRVHFFWRIVLEHLSVNDEVEAFMKSILA